MSNKALAIFGVVIYVLGVLASASDDSGNQLAPTALIAVAGLATFGFVIFASARLWKSDKVAVIIFAASSVSSAILSLVLTSESSNLNVLVNATKVAAFLSYFFVVFLLYKRPEKESSQS